MVKQMNARTRTKDLIQNYQIPKSTVAYLAGVHKPELSDYFRDGAVADNRRISIERAVDEIVGLIDFTVYALDVRPDLKDCAALRKAIDRYKQEKAAVST
jgi:hypothetical protein